MRARTAGWIAAAAPAAVGAAVGAAMLLAGDARALHVEMALPGVVCTAGLAISAIATVPLLLSRSRRSAAAAAAERATAAAEEAAQHERAQHRRFLARLDHELKNPIMAIRASAAAAEASEAWEAVDAQATRLSALVRDLRKLAELETIPLERAPVDLEVVVQDAIDALRRQDPRAGARLALQVTRVPWPVPPVLGDVDLLSLAVDNVLGNAAKYSASGPIEVRLREEHGRVVMEVADEGRGIPPEDLPQVFDELARASNARDVTGSGLGLTLVATVLRRHGGDVDVRSLASKGTVVTLRLPIGG
ncbi:HAMP domain-containing sensor histidine kinase [Microbacterium sp.]|uniref:sensor histidine kinase n=1 Tax=Microbacterium sp. TaxID=51671 RepID=UPI00333F0235